jgi:hypothetical protein
LTGIAAWNDPKIFHQAIGEPGRMIAGAGIRKPRHLARIIDSRRMAADNAGFGVGVDRAEVGEAVRLSPRVG